MAADSGDSVEVTGQLQMWGTLLDQDRDRQADPGGYGDPEDDPGFAIHRARIGLEGHRGPLSWQLIVGHGRPFDAVAAVGGGSSLQLVDAYGAWQFGPDRGEGVGLSLVAGMQKVPFLREELISSKDLVFQERAVASNWANPAREVGLLGDLHAGEFRARIGLFNGAGSLNGDDNTGKLVSGRVEWTRGDGYRTWNVETEDALSFGVGVLSDTDLATGTLGFDLDALIRIRRVSTLIQVSQTTQKPSQTDVGPPEVLAGTTRRGATAQVSYWLPLDDAEGATQGIEIAARGSRFDASTDIRDNGDVVIAHLGATWRDVAPGVDLGAGFIHREEVGGVTQPNDTARVWAQIRSAKDVGGGAASAAPVMNAWRQSFIGTWRAGGDLDGALLAFWEQPGLGLVGSFQMTEPRGKVVVGRPYPLDSFMYADRTLRVRMDPYGEGRDIVWFELTPSQDGQLCGFGYEDGRRADSVAGTGGGSWICWSVQSPESAVTDPSP